MNDNASIIYSKINLKRNLENYNFTNSLTDEKKGKLEDELIDCINNWGEDIRLCELDKLDDNEKKILLDENLINKDFYTKKEGKFIVFNTNNLSLILNNNDHININVIRNELSLDDAYETVDKIEKRLSKFFSFAASAKYGFLTSYVKDCGLAMKIYVLAQLLGVKLLKKEKEVFRKYFDRGYHIEPYNLIEGEEQKFENSDYYIISSRLNFGVSEKNLISRFTQGISRLLNLNKEFLKEYYNKNKDKLVDIIFRSYGILKYATRIEYKEALEHISNIRIGLILGENIPVTDKILNEIFIQIKEGHVNKYALINNIDKENARASIIKKLLV